MKKLFFISKTNRFDTLYASFYEAIEVLWDGKIN